jgi:hypothetical protein
MKQISYQMKDDKENGDLVPPSIKPEDKLLSYVRYTTSFTEERFRQLGLCDLNPELVKSLDCVDQIDALKQIGQAVADEQVKTIHFQDFSHDE